MDSLSKKKDIYDPDFLERIWIAFRNAWRNMRNKEVPKRSKYIYGALLLLEIIYIFSPIDIIPEIFLPLVGFLDDVGMVYGIFYTIQRFNRRSEEYLQLSPPDNIEQLPPRDPPK